MSMKHRSIRLSLFKAISLTIFKRKVPLGSYVIAKCCTAMLNSKCICKETSVSNLKVAGGYQIAFNMTFSSNFNTKNKNKEMSTT